MNIYDIPFGPGDKKFRADQLERLLSLAQKAEEKDPLLGVSLRCAYSTIVWLQKLVDAWVDATGSQDPDEIKTKIEKLEQEIKTLRDVIRPLLDINRPPR